VRSSPPSSLCKKIRYVREGFSPQSIESLRYLRARGAVKIENVARAIAYPSPWRMGAAVRVYLLHACRGQHPPTRRRLEARANCHLSARGGVSPPHGSSFSLLQQPLSCSNDVLLLLALAMSSPALVLVVLVTNFQMCTPLGIPPPACVAVFSICRLLVYLRAIMINLWHEVSIGSPACGEE
jgi:hypothetical protein